MLSLNRFWNDSGNKPLDIREVSYAFLLPTFRPDVNVRVRNIFYSHTPDIQQRDSHVFFLIPKHTTSPVLQYSQYWAHIKYIFEASKF